MILLRTRNCDQVATTTFKHVTLICNMKKYLFGLLIVLPLSLSACGVMVFVARPNAEFLSQTNDMDHSVILDINHGVEDMWFKIKKPADLTSGSVVTVTPIPNDINLSKINEIQKNEVPNPNLNDKITYEKIASSFIRGSLEKTSLFIVLIPILFIFAVVLLIRSFVNRRKNIEDSESLKKSISWVGSALVVSYLLFFPWSLFIFLSSMMGVGLGGGVSMAGVPTSLGIKYSNTDNITVTYSTTTESGTTLQLIQAENGIGLTSYLERNGLPKSPSNNIVLSRYVKEGYNFAVTFVPVNQGDVILDRYIHISFPSQQLFFPLGVNYADTDDKHGVKAMVLKPVTSQGFLSDFESKEENSMYGMRMNSDSHDSYSGDNLNKKISYYRNDENNPAFSVINFYDSKRNYNYDVFMSVGTPFSLKIFEFITTEAFLFIFVLLLIIFFVYLVHRLVRNKSDNYKKNFLLVIVSLPIILIFILCFLYILMR